MATRRGRAPTLQPHLWTHADGLGIHGITDFQAGTLKAASAVGSTFWASGGKVRRRPYVIDSAVFTFSLEGAKGKEKQTNGRSQAIQENTDSLQENPRLKKEIFCGGRLLPKARSSQPRAVNH